jgi:hypothetical protein
LNEATICGVSYDSDRAAARLLIETIALPEHGPVDPDPRRILVMSRISSLEVWLRPDRAATLGAALKLDSLHELERLFQSLRWAHAMYGWSFVDVTEPWDPISGPPSLRITASERPRTHTLRWFTECGRGQGPEAESFLLAGLIGFDELDVRRADDTPIGAEHFADEGARWWRAFSAHDERTGVDAQRQHSASAPHWRSGGDVGGVIVAG